jgi:hypothetical protein
MNKRNVRQDLVNLFLGVWAVLTPRHQRSQRHANPALFFGWQLFQYPGG